MTRYDDRGRRQGGRQSGYPQGRAQQGGYSDYGQERFGQPRSQPRRPYGDYPQHSASEHDFGYQDNYGDDPGQYGGYGGQFEQRPWSDERDWERRSASVDAGPRDWATQGRQHSGAYPRGPGRGGSAHGGQGSDVFGPRGSEGEMSQADQSQFDPDYHQWRNEQLRTLDDDYRNWRQDRYKKFSDEFSNWRKNRPSSGGESDSGSSGSKAGQK